jgi:hypothetical protein
VHLCIQLFGSDLKHSYFIFLQKKIVEFFIFKMSEKNTTMQQTRPVNSLWDMMPIELKDNILTYDKYQINWKTRFTNDVIPCINQEWQLVCLTEGSPCRICYLELIISPLQWKLEQFISCDNCSKPNTEVYEYTLCNFKQFTELYTRHCEYSAMIRMCPNVQEWSKYHITRYKIGKLAERISTFKKD